LQSAAVLWKDTGRARVHFTPEIGAQHSLYFAVKACLRGDCLVSACGRGEDSVDCVMNTWEDWSSCDASCGRGNRVRARAPQTLNSHGGRPCHVDLTQVEPCESVACEQICQPRDCTWADWNDWGACDKCGGQMKRFRSIVEIASCGGKNCEAAAAEEMTSCPRKCHELSYCVWGEWGAFGECTSTCGAGLKSRLRRLQVVNEPLGVTGLSDSSLRPEDLAQKLDDLEERARTLESQRLQQRSMAFTAGFLGLVATIALGRRRSWFTEEHGYTAASMEASDLE